jgi:hypothetical protein
VSVRVGVAVRVRVGVGVGEPVGVGTGVPLGVGVKVRVGVGVDVRVGVGVVVDVPVGVAVAALVGVRVAVGVLVATPLEVKLIISLGAVAGDPSKLAANFRPQAPPVPRKIIDKLVPLCQSVRLTSSWSTGAISSSVYQVLASHCAFEL